MTDDVVRLTDLEVIQRYSIAVRAETADRAELLDALLADVLWLQKGTATGSAASRTARARTAAKPVKPAVRARRR